MHLVDEARPRLRLHVRHVDGGPDVTGAVALYKSSRPNATPAEVKRGAPYLGNLNWKTSTDPDSHHEPLLDVSRIGAARDVRPDAPASTVGTARPARPATVPITVARSATFFERVRLSVTSLPSGWTGALDRDQPSWAGPRPTAGCP